MGTGTELERVDAPRGELSMVDGPDPQGAIGYARQISTAIADVLKPGNGYEVIQGRKHVTAEGWQTMAALTGHTCEIEYSRVVEGMEHPSGLHAWEARAVVRDQHGHVVAAGESMAHPSEGEPVGNRKGAPWARAEYSIRSMAQTRAMSRAMQARMRYVVQLAGFAGVPAEEMSEAAQAEQGKELARRRYKMLRDEVKVPDSILGDLIGNQGPELADDYFFAALAYNAGIVKAKSDDEPLEGEVVGEGEAGDGAGSPDPADAELSLPVEEAKKRRKAEDPQS